VDPHIVNLLFKPLEPPKSQLLGTSWIEPVHCRCTIDPSHLLPAFKDLSEHIGKHPVIWKKFYTNDDHKAHLPMPWNQMPVLEKMLIIKHPKPGRLMTAFQVNFQNLNL
jgi:hypothetical protein